MLKLRHLTVAMALTISGLSYAAVPVYEGTARADTYNNNPSYQAVGASGQQGGAQAPLSAQGQLFVQLQQMQQEISMLRGMLEEQSHEIKQLKQQSLERYQELDGRFNQLSQSAANQPASSSNGYSGNESQEQSIVSVDPEKEKLFYDAAYDLIKQRDFDKAHQAFTAFLRKYPQSQYSANAQYWLGEVNLTQNNLKAAAESFALVSKNWPTHNKVPDSLYKLGDVELRLGNTGEAESLWQQLVSRYPDSSAAQLAKRELRNF